MEHSKSENIQNQFYEHQGLLQSVIENSAEGIALVDQNGHFLIFNSMMMELLGSGPVDSPDYEWATLFNIYYPDGIRILEKERLPIVRALKGEVIKHEIYLFKNPKKGEVYVSISASPIKDAGGNILGSLVIDHDITEQLKAERQIEAANEELRQVQAKLLKANQRLENAQRIARLGYIELDLVTRALYWSEQVYQICGIDPSGQAIDFQQFIALIHPDDRQRYLTALDELNGVNKREMIVEYRIVHPNNQQICSLLETGRVNRDDTTGALKMESTLQDITRLKQRELERTRLIDELTQQNRNLEEFGYVISHNLRAPVANIMGFLELLNDENLDRAEWKELIGGLSLAAEKLDAVTKELNAVVQVKKDGHENKQDIDLPRLFNEVKDGLRELIGKVKMTIHTSFEVTSIYSIRSFLHSIFFNLLSNSIKYRREDVMPLVQVSTRRKENRVVLRFRDNGLGLDIGDNSNDVFGLYKRFHHHVEGKGVGLFMVKSHVEALNGKVTFKSKSNEGTELIIELPLA